MNAQQFALPRTLLHGTSAQALDRILVEGIKPRGKSGVDNWRHTIGSNSRCVYLTDTYALYFGWNASKDCDVAVIEIDTALVAYHLGADEDAVEQTTRGKDGLPSDWSMKKRTMHYRARNHEYNPAGSLAALGTCTHRGTIPPSAITRYCIVPKEKTIELILHAHDPSISLLNHYFVGEKHRQFHRWLLGDEPFCEASPMLKRDGIRIESYLGAEA